MISYQVLQYLENQGYGVIGTNLFNDFMQDKPDDSICIYDESAPTLEESNCLTVDNHGIQIVVRNSSMITCAETANEIHKLIVGLGGNEFKFAAGGNSISYVTVQTGPFSIGKDNDGRANYSSHYVVRAISENDSNRK